MPKYSMASICPKDQTRSEQQPEQTVIFFHDVFHLLFTRIRYTGCYTSESRPLGPAINWKPISRFQAFSNLDLCDLYSQLSAFLY